MDEPATSSASSMICTCGAVRGRGVSHLHLCATASVIGRGEAFSGGAEAHSMLIIEGPTRAADDARKSEERMPREKDATPSLAPPNGGRYAKPHQRGSGYQPVMTMG